MTASVMAAFFLDTRRSSTAHVTPTSSNEMLDVRAAIPSSMKKPVPKIRPPYGSGGIDARSEGSTTNTIPGPLTEGSNPEANRVGKMMSPASMAISVSAPVTHAAEETRSSFFDTYEPYVIIAPIPRLIEKNACPTAFTMTPPAMTLKSGLR